MSMGDECYEKTAKIINDLIKWSFGAQIVLREVLVLLNQTPLLRLDDV